MKARRSQWAAPEQASARLAAEDCTCAQLRRLLEVGKILLRTERFEEVWPRLWSFAAEGPALHSAVLVTVHAMDRPFGWWGAKVSAADRQAALVRAQAHLAGPWSGSRPQRDGPRFFLCPLLGLGGEPLGVLQMEWSAAPSGAEVSYAAALADQLAAALDRHAREEAARGQLARASVRASEDLLATVSHELKNLLCVVLTNLSLLGGSAALQTSDQGWESLKRIRRAADRMRRLVADLQDMACIEAEHLSVEPQRVEVLPMVAEALEAVAPLAALRSIRLRSEVPESLPTVWVDGTRMQQVFTNLLVNAIKFSPEGGAITVRAQRFGGQVRFSVADEGPGIPPEDLPRLFDRYWQARRAIKLGVGLGLFIVKGIVQAHGGRVWVESAPGQGTTFFVTVPVSETTRPGASHPDELNAGSTTRQKLSH